MKTARTTDADLEMDLRSLFVDQQSHRVFTGFVTPSSAQDPLYPSARGTECSGLGIFDGAQASHTLSAFVTIETP